MTIFDSALLGIIQGLTEFLPVSSSGHLVLLQEALGVNEPGILFESILHLGTTLAIIIFFFGSIKKFSKRDLSLIAIGSIPAGLFGFFFLSFLESLFESLLVVGVALLITSIFNFFTDRAQARREKINLLDTVFIGIAQALAIVPGISRSGSTIFMGAWMGIKRERAAEFSFLLSIPAILGANILQLASHGINANASIINYLTGFVFALIFGIIAISIVLRILFERKFKFFASYTAILGLTVIAIDLFVLK